MVSIETLEEKQRLLKSFLREDAYMIGDRLKRNEAQLTIQDLRGLIREMTRTGAGVKRIDAVRYEIARREKAQ